MAVSGKAVGQSCIKNGINVQNKSANAPAKVPSADCFVFLPKKSANRRIGSRGKAAAAILPDGEKRKIYREICRKQFGRNKKYRKNDFLRNFVDKKCRFRKNVIKERKNCIQIVFIYQNMLEIFGNP